MNESNPWDLLLKAVMTVWCLLLAPGCGPGYGEKSEYELAKGADQEFIDTVKAVGGSAEKTNFQMFGQQGMAWTIDLNGARIDDALIDSMCKLGYIGRLNLGKSAITNEQLLKLDAQQACRATIDLDLSQTAIDDATLDKLENFNCLQTAKLTGTKVTIQAVQRFTAKRRNNDHVPAPFKNPKIEL